MKRIFSGKAEDMKKLNIPRKFDGRMYACWIALTGEIIWRSGINGGNMRVCVREIVNVRIAALSIVRDYFVSEYFRVNVFANVLSICVRL